MEKIKLKQCLKKFLVIKISDSELFTEFMERIEEKFNKEDKKHGDSWKTVEIYKLRRFLKQHVDKWLDNHNSKVDPNQETLDLIDIANYCMMLFHRLKAVKIITICGSSKFKEEILRIDAKLSLEGNIVISLGCFGHADELNLTRKQEAILERVHQEKMNMSDEIFVVNKDGYIGEHTERDIEYAKSRGLKIRYLNEVEERE